MKKLMIAALAMVAFGAANVSAQTASASASVTVPTVLSITVTNQNIAFPSATATDFTNGYVGTATSSSIDTKGNVVHDVTIQADAATFTYTGAETDPNKGASDLLWSSNGGTSWTALDNAAAVDVATALARGVNSGAATVDYRIALSLTNDVPGDYSLGFTYTVVAN